MPWRGELASSVYYTASASEETGRERGCTGGAGGAVRQSRGAPRAGSSLQEARSKGRGTPRSLTRGPRGASGQPTAAVRSPRPPGGKVGPAQLSGDRGWRPAALEAGAGPFNRATGQRVQEPLWRPPHTHLSPPHVSRGLSVPLLPQLHPPALPHPLCTAADEVTVGKVYAALMIFDFYKQSKSSRDQTHQAPGGLTQVPAPGFPHGSPCRPLSDGPGNAHRSREGLVREEEDGALQAPGSDLTRLGAVRQPAPGRAGEPPRRGARVPSREREGLRTAPGDATFLSGRAVGGDCWAGASVSRSPLTSAGATEAAPTARGHVRAALDPVWGGLGPVTLRRRRLPTQPDRRWPCGALSRKLPGVQRARGTGGLRS